MHANRFLRGFTLLEVLIAMAVFAVAAMALLNAGREQIQASSRLEDKTFAHWVAMNRIVEMQLSGQFPEIGRGDTRVKLAGREWKVLTTIDGTPINNVRRMTVDVSEDNKEFGEDAPIVTSLTAFISNRKTGNGRRSNADES